MSVVANVAINVDSSGAVSKLRQVQSQAQSTEKAFGGIASAVGKLAAVLGVIEGAKFVFAKTAELETQTRSLQVLTGSAEKAKQIIQDLQQLGAVTPFTSTELIDAAKRLQAFGVESDKVVETTKRLADVSGATGAELQGLVTAYGQVQAKGRLQGEELLQFQERGVALQAELQKMYKLSGKELQDALSKGQISAEAVEVAIKRLTDAGGKYANGASAQSDTLAGKFSTLQDNIEQLARTLGEVLSPVLKAILNQAIQTLDGINRVLGAGRAGAFARSTAAVGSAITVGAPSQAIDIAATGVGQVTPQRNKVGIEQNLQALAQYQANLTRIRAGDVPDPQTQERLLAVQKDIQTRITQNLAAQKQLEAATRKTGRTVIGIPPLLPRSVGGGGKAGGGGGAASNAAAQQEKQTQDRLRSLTRETELTSQITDLKSMQAAAERAGDRELQVRLAGEEQIVNIIQSTAQALDGVTDKRLQQAILSKAQAQIDQSRVSTIDQLGAIEDERAKSYATTLANAQLELRLAQETDPLKRAMIQIDAQIATEQFKALGYTEAQVAALKKVLVQTAMINSATEQTNKLYADMASATAGAFGSAIDAMLKGTEDLGKALQNIGVELLNTIAKMMIMYAVGQALGAISGGKGFLGYLAKGFGYEKANAKGNVFAQNGIVPFAKGGIVTGPTLFPFAKGTGLMGEAGPEAIMPLARGADGKLGVMANGGGGDVNVVVNVDASGSKVEGDSQQGNQLGRIIAGAVQAEIIKQKRPGGLLA